MDSPGPRHRQQLRWIDAWCLLPVFKTILERIMEGHTTAEDYLFLKEHNERVDQAGGFASTSDVKVLCARLEDKDNLNRDMLLKISEASGEPIVRIELELIQSHMTQKPMLRGEVYAQIGCAQAEQT